jgi:hypothetical protein
MAGHRIKDQRSTADFTLRDVTNQCDLFSNGGVNDQAEAKSDGGEVRHISSHLC